MLFSDVGGDVMVFYADNARDIVRIINDRRQLLLGSPLSIGKSLTTYIRTHTVQMYV